MISFSWDNRKNDANKKMHGVSFDEAKTVFYDENAIRYFDPDHSDDEDRFLMVGLSNKLRILIVCHCYSLLYCSLRLNHFLNVYILFRYEYGHSSKMSRRILF